MINIDVKGYIKLITMGYIRLFSFFIFMYNTIQNGIKAESEASNVFGLSSIDNQYCKYMMYSDYQINPKAFNFSFYILKKL